jgi:hypothetical protein
MAHVRMCHHAASAAAIAFPHAWQRVPVRKYRTDLKADMGRAKRKRLQWVELYRLPPDRSRRQIQPVDAAPGIGETLATTIMLETGSNLTTPLQQSCSLAFNELTKAHSDSYLSRALVLFIAPEFPSRAACSR